MSKKIATIAYLRELNRNIGSGYPKKTVDDTYCPTYGEITGGTYFDYYDGENSTGLMIGHQYSVDENTDGHYEDNQCVCEIDIMAINVTGLNLSIIQSGTTNYGTTGNVDCMVDYNELISGSTPYNDLPYLKVELKGIKYQKIDDGQEITRSNTNIEFSKTDSITYTGNATGLTDNKSTSSHKYSLYARLGNRYSNTITITQLGEKYGYYSDSEQTKWVNAINYSGSGYSTSGNAKITTGWLDDYGDNSGTTNGRDAYNTDQTDYKRGIEVATNIITDTNYTGQSNSGTSTNFGKPLPTGSTSSTYHIAFADDANSGTSGNSLHWLFKDEPIELVYSRSCYGGQSSLACSLAGSSSNNEYEFSSSRRYFKPQHCYGKTSIDRIYKKDASGNLRKDKDGNLMPDKGFSQNPIDNLQGQYPQHWRRQIATYKQDQPWTALTADTESMAKVTIYEKISGSKDDFAPSHRTNDGNKVSSARTSSNYAYISFPNNQNGKNEYEAYPFFHYLSPEICEIDSTEKGYHRISASTLTNFEEADSGKTYAYSMSIGKSGNTMTQDNSYYYLTYNGAYTYSGGYCTITQVSRDITYIKEYTGPEVLDNVILYDDVSNYVNSIGSGEPTRRNGFFSDSYFLDDGSFSPLLPYSSSVYDGDHSYGSSEYQNVKQYTIISDDTKIPSTKEEWASLLADNNAWSSSSAYFYENSGNNIVKSVTKSATVPYQIWSFDFDTNANVSADIYGSLSKVATASVDNSNNTVTVTIDYGENFTGNAYSGGVDVSDDYGHTISFPISYSEQITMAEAREMVSNGYGAINSSDNYWCRTDGQGDKGKEYL